MLGTDKQDQTASSSELAKRRRRALQQAADEGLELQPSEHAASGYKHVYRLPSENEADQVLFYGQLDNVCINIKSPVAEEVALSVARVLRNREGKQMQEQSCEDTANHQMSQAHRTGSSGLNVQGPLHHGITSTSLCLSLSLEERREAAIHAAQMEGLRLIPGIGSSGFKGVYRNAFSSSSHGPQFSAIVNLGCAQTLHLGNFYTAEEGALQYARHKKEKEGGLLENAVLTGRDRGDDGQVTTPSANTSGRKRPISATSRMTSTELHDISLSTSPSAADASPFSTRHQADAGLIQSRESPAFIPTVESIVWAKAGHWWPAYVQKVLPSDKFEVMFFAAPSSTWAEGITVGLGEIHAFSQELNRNHKNWLKGAHFGTDNGKPKHPKKRAQLKTALKEVEMFDQGIKENKCGCADAGAAGLQETTTSLSAPKAVYEEGATIGSMLQQLGLFERLAQKFDEHFDLWEDTSIDDLQYIRQLCRDDLERFRRLANSLGLGTRDIIAMRSYFKGLQFVVPNSRLWESDLNPLWKVS